MQKWAQGCAVRDRNASEDEERLNKVALTVFTTSAGEVEKDKEPETSEGVRQTLSEPVLQDADACLVKTSETIRLAPRAKQIVVGRLELPKRQAYPKFVVVEPAQLPLEGVLAARGLVHVVANPHKRTEREGMELKFEAQRSVERRSAVRPG
jgi:hypothetical protein